MGELEGNLAPLMGIQNLSGARSRKIAKLLLFLVPLFAFAFVVALVKKDHGHTLFFGSIFLLVSLISCTLFYGLRRINQFEGNAQGITFLPANIHVSIEEVTGIESALNKNGGDIHVLSLNSRRFIPYFGLVWCFGRHLAINTEPGEIS